MEDQITCTLCDEPANPSLNGFCEDCYFELQRGFEKMEDEINKKWATS